MKLTPAEEQVMKYLWKLEKAYMKDIVEEFPDPKPAYTTIATLLKRMTDKEFVGFRQHGNVREYYPKVKKPDYFSRHLQLLIRDFFNDSSAQFASFFTNETDLSKQELEELKAIIEKEIDKKK